MPAWLALTHTPSPRMGECVRSHGEQPIDLERAASQHAAYGDLLGELGLRVAVLDANADCPDCVFIEDTAVVLDEVAVLCSMGHESRRREPAGIEPELRKHREVRRIELPSLIDGGDVLRVGRRFLVGLSARTNPAGMMALADILALYGYDTVAVSVEGCLHLKSACTALPDGRLLANPAWLDMSELSDFEIVPLPSDEPDAANVLLAGETVCAAAGHPQTADLIRGLGFTVYTVDLSEFAKADGCVTCLSLLLRT